MGIIFFLKWALHLNHPLSVAATVKGITVTTAQKWQVEKMKIRGHENEDRLSLFRSHSHRHSRRRSHSHRHSRRWLKGSNQETGNGSVGTTVRRQTSVLLGQRAAPAASQREVMSLRAWSSSSLIALYLSFWAYSSSRGWMSPGREFKRRGTGDRRESWNGEPQMSNERKKSGKTKHELGGSCVLWKKNKKTKERQSDF